MKILVKLGSSKSVLLTNLPTVISCGPKLSSTPDTWPETKLKVIRYNKTLVQVK